MEARTVPEVGKELPKQILSCHGHIVMVADRERHAEPEMEPEVETEVVPEVKLKVAAVGEPEVEFKVEPEVEPNVQFEVDSDLKSEVESEVRNVVVTGVESGVELERDHSGLECVEAEAREINVFDDFKVFNKVEDVVLIPVKENKRSSHRVMTNKSTSEVKRVKARPVCQGFEEPLEV